MVTAERPNPEGYPRLTPYLAVAGAAEAVDFYREVFGATQRLRLEGPDGRIGHAELELGDSLIMLADEHPEIGVRGPRSIGGTPVTLSVYVGDVDEVFATALAKGSTRIAEPADQFYGDRTARFEDPFGHRWSVSTHIEDVSAEEMNRRAAEIDR